jgi:hypothetical protein
MKSDSAAIRNFIHSGKNIPITSQARIIKEKESLSSELKKLLVILQNRRDGRLFQPIVRPLPSGADTPTRFSGGAASQNLSVQSHM